MKALGNRVQAKAAFNPFWIILPRDRAMAVIYSPITKGLHDVHWTR